MTCLNSSRSDFLIGKSVVESFVNDCYFCEVVRNKFETLGWSDDKVSVGVDKCFADLFARAQSCCYGLIFADFKCDLTLFKIVVCFWIV